MNQETIKVSGVVMTLKPYSEKRKKALDLIKAEIDKWVSDNPEATIEDVPLELKADWWKRKAEVLWEPATKLPDDFFKSDEFESSLLQDTESFFIVRRMYL